jgi:hypothetical protein
VSDPAERPEGVLYEPLIWSISGFLIVSGAVLSILMWTNVIGPFRFMGLPGAPGTTTVGLWVPQAPDRAVSPETSRRLGRWRAALPQDTPVVWGNDLVELVEQGVQVIVLADGRSLSAFEAASLWQWLADGGAAILTGALGVRDREGEWRGFGLMGRMLDEPAIHLLDTEASQTLSAWSRGPLSARLGPGETIRMAPEPGVPALATRVAELRWGTRDGPDAGRASGAAKRLSVGRGRAVWLASGPESTWEESREPWQGMVRLVDAALAWCTHRATVEILAWPDGARFAGVVTGAGVDSDPDADETDVVETREDVRARLEDAARAGALASFRVGGADLHQFAVRALSNDGGWFARDASVVRSWEDRRDRLVAAVERTGPQRWLLEVSNLGPEPLAGAVIRIHLNRAVRSAAVERTVLLQEEPRLRLRRAQEQLDVILPEVPAGTSQAYSVDIVSSSPLVESGTDRGRPGRNSAAYSPGAEQPIRSME